ncbi:MAG: membrane protein insertion efficiency factor YidD [Patescibacteria group bacterium]|nr:membrane protein insertion efficiency factor YidD [Patescibacteria group bacterium]MDD4304659.1 membrane protein insertion efficiency factor YidD [Patescibacteria group bacterium]MDD4695700.1 membrane protein insertion efficiency factor YidD [Patescibacteria group bacterium]
MKIFLLYIIRVYQKTLSPDSGWFSYKHPHGYCRFYPHCSEYSHQAIEKYGVLNGFYKSIKRIIRCNPFSKGGYDPLN